MLKMLDLFSGIGGFSLAASWTGGIETVAFCEIEPYCQRVLKKHWPNVPIHSDIKELRGEDIGSVDIVCGGFPCQPHSCAGKRLASNDERDLWSEYARIVCEIRPKWVVGENVEGLLSSESGRFFGRILRDLALLRYRTEWHCFPSAAVGTGHFRNRTFLLAFNADLLNDCSFRKNKKFKEIAFSSGMYGQILCPKWEKDKSTGRPYIATRHREQFLHEPGICRVANGVPHRMDRLRGCGNAIVPQAAFPILQEIVDIESQAN